MASSSDIQNLITQIKNQRADYDTRWLQWYLGHLKGDQQDAAIQAVQQRVESGDLGNSVNDINVDVHQAVDQKVAQDNVFNNPAQRLAGQGHMALTPFDDHTPYSADQLKALQNYFDTDKFLKDHKDAQNAIVDQLLKNAGAGDPVEKAKQINFDQRSQEERTIYYGQKASKSDLNLEFLTDDTAAQRDGITIPNNAFTDQDNAPKALDVSALKKYIASLPNEATKVATVDAIRKWAQDNSHWTPLQSSDINNMLQAAHQTAADSLGRQYALTTNAAQKQELLKQAQGELMPGQQLTDASLRPKAAAAASKPAASTTAQDQIPFGAPSGAGTNWKPSSDQADLYKQVTGQDFEKAYQAFSQNYAIAAQQYDQNTGLLYGKEQIWTQGNYNPTTGAWTYGEAVPKSQAQGQRKGQNVTPSRAQFMAMQSTGKLKLAYQVENLARQYWTQNYGTQIPQDLMSQIYGQINKLSMDQVYELLGSSGSSGSSPLSYLITGGKTSTGQWSGNGAIDQVIESYVSNHPELTQASTQQAAVNNFITQYTNTIGHAPSAAEIQQATGADATTINTIIDNVQMGNGMTYGTYSKAYSRLAPQWQQYFGKDPSATQLAWSVGRTDQDIQDYINNSPSRVSGLNIGTYEGYQKFLDDVGGGLWGTGSNDAMVQALHQHVSSK